MAKEIIRVGQMEVNFFLEGKDTNGQVAMFDIVLPIGGKPPMPHYHESYDETLYGLEGAMPITNNI